MCDQRPVGLSPTLHAQHRVQLRLHQARDARAGLIGRKRRLVRPFARVEEGFVDTHGQLCERVAVSTRALHHKGPADSGGCVGAVTLITRLPIDGWRE